MKYKINIINKCEKKFLLIKKIWNLKNDNNSKFSLIIKPNRIELKNNSLSSQKNIWVNFNYKNYQKYKKDKKIKIIKAIKIKKNKFINIIDATAGLGKDAFIFFSYGCKVTMIERHPILSILLFDGLKRGYQDKKIGHLIKKNINIIYNTSMNINQLNIPKPDVIYLDPMFQKKKNNALSKKEIRTIQNLVKYDFNTNLLFQKCFLFCKNKVVVKRPKNEKTISKKKPNYNIKTKKYRFDIYLK